MIATPAFKWKCPSHVAPIERRQRLAQLPHVVQIPIPPDGLRQHLNEIHTWACKRCGAGGYAESGKIERDREGRATEFVLFRFPDAQTARDFIARFAELGVKLGATGN